MSIKIINSFIRHIITTRSWLFKCWISTLYPLGPSCSNAGLCYPQDNVREINCSKIRQWIVLSTSWTTEASQIRLWLQAMSKLICFIIIKSWQSALSYSMPKLSHLLWNGHHMEVNTSILFEKQFKSVAVVNMESWPWVNVWNIPWN